MGALIDIVEEYLVDIGWEFEKDDDNEVLKMGVNAENASYRVIIYSFESNDFLTVYIGQDNNVPENKRALLAEFVARANYGLNLGHFEYDMSDGTLGYKLAISIDAKQLTTDMVGTMVDTGVSNMDQYYPGLMAVLFGHASPEEAILQIEKPPTTH